VFTVHRRKEGQDGAVFGELSCLYLEIENENENENGVLLCYDDDDEDEDEDEDEDYHGWSIGGRLGEVMS
jgi:hypothetical protein